MDYKGEHELEKNRIWTCKRQASSLRLKEKVGIADLGTSRVL